MEDAVRAHRDAALDLIDDLVRRGCQIKGALVVDVIRAWQRDCAAAINQMSGGSKAHWLARAYSNAFLVRATGGAVVVEASASEIVDRILDVLAQARASLSSSDNFPAAAAAAPVPRRFDFVHNLPLRPIVAQAFADGTRALEAGDIETAFIASCSVLDALLTDALDHKGLHVADLSFDARIEAAQREGLIGGGCARLPAVARRYRDVTGDEGHVPGGTISERDARVVRQVLMVVMRDLDPGR
ncbi:MAG: hypothetical protein ACRD3C_16165 [Vicinamibacterales bacterium]